MLRKRRNNIIAYVLLVLVVIAVIGFVARFTNGFTSDFKTFYVSVNGKDILTSANGYVVTSQDALSVDVKYTFAFGQSEAKGYTVKIVPNKTDKDFSFSVDGDIHYFGSEKDLTNGFIIDKKDKSFTVTAKGNTPLEILQAVYPESELICENNGYKDMFSLIVTSYNGASSVKLTFTLEVRVTGITFNREVIIF